MALGIPPGTQHANAKNLATADQRLDQLNSLESQVDGKLADPAYATPAQQADLNKVKADIEKAKKALDDEKSIREDLDYQLDPPADNNAAKADLKKLDDLRKKTYPQYFKNGSRVGNPCIPCMTKKMTRVKPSLMPRNAEEAANDITGIFEGGKPDYCALADNPGDAGKLSYGKHQASETSGNLKDMLQRYSNSTGPAPDPALKTQMDDQLKHFSANGESYQGTAAQRTALKQLLKKACKDPAMQKTQDDFFNEMFLDPAVARASKFGVSSPLGKAMYYDMEIQGGGLVDGFSKHALKKWSDENGVNPPATGCAPNDPNGPDEKTFLYLVNAERRKTMENSSNALYKSTTWRPDNLDQLLDQDNLDLSKNFTLLGQPVNGLPQQASPPVSGDAPH
jgi:hypothetical protein